MSPLSVHFPPVLYNPVHSTPLFSFIPTYLLTFPYLLFAFPTNSWFSIIYTVTCATFVPIVYFFYPETSGRSLEEIDAIFTESRSIFDAVAVAKRMPRVRLAELEKTILNGNANVREGEGQEKGDTKFVEYAEG